MNIVLRYVKKRNKRKVMSRETRLFTAYVLHINVLLFQQFLNAKFKLPSATVGDDWQ